MPRRILPGLVYFLTRRCTQRQFLLKPGKYVNLVLLYLLAEAAQRFNVTVYAYCAMSNHIHLVVRDNEGNLPQFMAHFYKLVAKVLNVHWARTENLWSNEQASVVRLVQDNDALEKIVYTLANPVQDNLVENVPDWPGISSYGLMLNGKEKETRRPPGFFKPDGPMDEVVILKLARPPGYEDMPQNEWAEHLAKELRHVEDAMRAARKKDAKLRKQFVGRQKVLAAKHTDSAKRIESRNELNPQVACLEPDRRMQELLSLKGFREAHHYALVDWCAGDRSALFPRGTYKMRKFGVVVDGEPRQKRKPLKRAQPRRETGPRKTRPRAPTSDLAKRRSSVLAS